MLLATWPTLADVPKLQSNFHFSAHVFRLNSHFGHNFAVFTFALALTFLPLSLSLTFHLSIYLSPFLSLSLLAGLCCFCFLALSSWSTFFMCVTKSSSCPNTFGKLKVFNFVFLLTWQILQTTI